jgi:hypothetical protein
MAIYHFTQQIREGSFSQVHVFAREMRLMPTWIDV